MASNSVNLHLILSQVLDVIPILLTIIGNTICLLTLVKTSTLHTPSNVFLGALCISDLFVGFVVHPLFIINANAMMNNDRRLERAEFCASVMGASCSSFIAMMISIDRCMAVCYPFAYIRMASCKANVTITALGSVMLCCICIIMPFLCLRCVFLSLALLGMLAYSVIIITYVMIYRVVCKQRKVVVTLGEILGSNRQEIFKKRRERSRTFTIAIVLSLFLLFYTPAIVWLFYSYVIKLDLIVPTSMHISGVWVKYVAMLQSCVNPMVYCLRCADIKTAACRLLGTRKRFHRGRNVIANAFVVKIQGVVE